MSRDIPLVTDTRERERLLKCILSSWDWMSRIDYLGQCRQLSHFPLAIVIDRRSSLQDREQESDPLKSIRTIKSSVMVQVKVNRTIRGESKFNRLFRTKLSHNSCSLWRDQYCVLHWIWNHGLAGSEKSERATACDYGQVEVQVSAGVGLSRV